MKLYKFTFFIVLAASVISACSSSAETARVSPSSNAKTPPAVNAPANANSDQAVTTENGQANVDANTPGSPMDAAVNRGKKLVDTPASGPPPPLRFEPAGDDSEVAASMRPDGTVFEVRVFKTDPQIAKVELTWLSPTEKAVKLYLRGGKVMDIKTDKIPNLKTTTLKQLREAFGIQPPPPPVIQERPSKG